MKIPLLPNFVLNNTRPSFYDCESVTVIELASRLYGKMNDVITEINNFVDTVNTKITEFEAETEEEIQLFETAIRQEFQDFIDTINLKIQEQDNKIESAENYMRNNINAVTRAQLEEYISSGVLSIGYAYDETTEALNPEIIIGGDQ